MSRRLLLGFAVVMMFATLGTASADAHGHSDIFGPGGYWDGCEVFVEHSHTSTVIEAKTRHFIPADPDCNAVQVRVVYKLDGFTYSEHSTSWAYTYVTVDVAGYDIFWYSDHRAHCTDQWVGRILDH